MYGRELKTILLVYTLPTFPVALLLSHATGEKAYGLAFLAFLLSVIVSLFAYGALASVISDAAVGERTSASRAYRRMSAGLAFRLLGTNLRSMLQIGLASLLLVIPGLVLAVRYLFAPIIVVIEQQAGSSALKRSAELGKGKYWRNAGAVLLVVVVATVIAAGVGFAIGIVFALTGESAQWLVRSVNPFLDCFITQPLLLTTLTLLYYDLRVRKEGYDVRALAEDLRR